jgi:hypothetical protein
MGLKLSSNVHPPLPGAARIVKTVGVPLASESRWLALTDQDEVLQIDLLRGDIRRVCAMADLNVSIDQELSLHVSRDGKFAVANDYCPLGYNRATQEFLTQDADGRCRLSKLASM